MRFSLVRPDFAFVSVWLAVIGLYFVADTALNPPFTPEVAWMLGINLVTAPLILLGVRYTIWKRGDELSPQELHQLSADDVRLIHHFSMLLFAIWAMIYLANVAYSGGIPVLWALMGSNRSYADFGIPTVAGFNFMLRCFLSILWIYLYNVTHKKKYLLLILLFLALYLGEISRGGMFFFILHVVCAYLILNRPRAKVLLGVTAFGTLALVAFVILGSMRGITLSPKDFGAEDQLLGGMPTGFFWIWLYMETPIGNVNHASALGIVPNYLPLNIIAPVLPTVLREVVLGPTSYAIALVNPTFNATTAYAPMIADFGYGGATLITGLIQTIASYVYVRAKQGSIIHILLYPPLFVSIILSIFYLYAASLLVLTYPWLCILLRNYVARKKAEEAASQAPDPDLSPYNQSLNTSG